MEQYSIEECEQLFMALFPHGFAGSDVADTLAPDGWEKSPYILAFHPMDYKIGEIHPKIELQEIVAACVWDIFSDNNDVVKDGKCV